MNWARIFRKKQSAPDAQAIEQAIQIGLDHHRAGRLPEAERCYQEVLRSDPANADVLHLLGVVAAQVGKTGLAVEMIDKALSIKPDYAEALCSRGNALQELRRYEEAIASYDRALSIKSGIAETSNNRGNTWLVVQSEIAEVLCNRGRALKAISCYEEALASYNRALSLRPEFAEALCGRGNMLEELKQPGAALASYDRAIAIKPENADAHICRGNVLQKLTRLKAAVSSYDRAIVIKPDSAEAYSNRGTALQELMQLDAAVASYDRAIAIKPDYASAYWNKSFVLLLRGDFENGWPLHEWRWRRGQAGRHKRDFPQPLWLGKEPLSGKTILLHSEQGLGDTIQFCRYARLVANLDAHVIMEVPEPLLPLLKDLDGVSQFVAKGSALPAFDYHCPLLSLPLAFRTDLGSIPCPRRYLRADREHVAIWRVRLGEPTKPRIGLVWSGNTEHKYDHSRSMALAELVKHLPSKYEYVSLQKDVREADRPKLEARLDILHFGDELKDFADTAALCEQLRLIISVDTSVAHLAGALGKPVWILLPYRPDWRWMLERTDSPWYPGARLFRQEKSGDWDAVMKRVKAELAPFS